MVGKKSVIEEKCPKIIRYEHWAWKKKSETVWTSENSYEITNSPLSIFIRDFNING